MKRTYTIQENGQVTLPMEWRERFRLKKGDEVTFEETAEGLLISPRKAVLARLLDEISDDLQAKGVTLEELMRDGRKIRADILKEKYGIETTADGD